MNRFFFIASILLVSASCEKKSDAESKTDSVTATTAVSDTTKKEEVTATADTVKAPKETLSEAKGDTFTFSIKGYLLLQPDAQTIERMQKDNGGDFETIADDASYYYATAQGFLEKNKIPFDQSEMRYIRFLKADGASKIIDRYKDGGGWDVYFFDTKNDPEKADMVMIEEEFKNKYQKNFN
ncbi:MAG: hypothetical protein K2X86_09470 [Cytophagaceae bacterium]|nr:hypothetical protein [Cytophagaceae bacterium]